MMKNDFYILKRPLPEAGRLMMKQLDEVASFFSQLREIHERNKRLLPRLNKLENRSVSKIESTHEVLISWDGPNIWINDLRLQEFHREVRMGISVEDSMFSHYFEESSEFEGYFAGKDYGI